ncbi:MAG TPA: hypothetical protein VN326_20500 [Casimicrobiaceae bacterium]|nr:hypothetical protein [Casimicrobiaceae bacterium]
MRAYGHGFGLRYDLPLPLALWIIGAACAILLSFLVVAIAVRANASVEAPAQPNLLRWQIDNTLAGPNIRLIAQLLSVAALILVVVAGIIGDQTPTRNLAPTAIWIAWWVGFCYLSAFVGNVWSVVNPWAAIFDWCERILSKPRAPRRAKVNWPKSLGVWPAIALFIVFAWLELIWEGRSIPSQLAWLAIGFSVLTWTGMFIFGRSTWLTHADPFALTFSVLSKFGPTDICIGHGICDTCPANKEKVESDPGEASDRDRCYRGADSRGRWILRPPGVGLLDTENMSQSLSVFVVVMLSTVTFDGFMATPVWQRIENALYVALPVLGDSRLAIINTLGLLVFCATFIAVYRLVATLIAHASGNRMTPDAANRAFVLTLVPIAIAYLVAHYLSYFLIQGQLLIRLASDPFGFGWNILGTAHFRPDIGIVGARFVWYTSLVAIVLGHVAAVSLAHIVALRRLVEPRLAIRSQIPMLVLMIAYTMVSLWIIAQPIVE